MADKILTISADEAWQQALKDVLAGKEIVVRSKKTIEVINYSFSFDMTKPVVTIKERQLGYYFMVAEAYWMLMGSNRLDELEPFSKMMPMFSDSGYVLQGAYGPKVTEQMWYIIETLEADVYSRQAVINIWREMPRNSNDIPCTLSLQFMIRPRKAYLQLDCRAVMRSSDTFFGLPYDMFSFSIIALYLVMRLHERRKHIRPGLMYFSNMSQHIYKQHYEISEECEVSENTRIYEPIDIYSFNYPDNLCEHLDNLRSKRFDNLTNTFLEEIQSW